MANGSIAGTTSNAYTSSKIVWSSVPDTENNRSVVTASLELYKSSSVKSYGTGTWSVTINGETTSVTQYHEFSSAAGWVRVVSASATVDHGADGTKTIGISGAGGIPGTSLSSVSVLGSAVLDAIPRASTVTLSTASANFGDTVTASIVPASQSFSHRLKWSLGQNSSEQTLGAGTLSKSFTIPPDWMQSIPNSASARLNCECATYSGATRLGSCTAYLSANVPASVVPTLTALSAEPSDAVWGLAIQGRSKAKLTFSNASGVYGSTITEYTVTGVAPSSSPILETPILLSGGEISFTGYVTDSRGRRSEVKTASLTVYAHDAPTLSASAARCLSNGTIDPDGTYIKASAAYSCSPCGGNNTVSLTLKYRKVGDAGWTAASAPESGGSSLIGGGNILCANDHEVSFEAVDALGRSSSYIAAVPRSFRLLNVSGPMSSVAIGRMANAQSYFQCALNADFEGNVSVDGGVTTGGAIASGGDISCGNLFATGNISANGAVLATALPIASGGTGAADATAARANILTALKPKKLWSGSFAGGTITVPELSDYALVAATCASDPAIWMIGSNGTYGATFGLYQGAGISCMYCRCNQSGDSLTIDGNFRGAGYYNGGSYPSALTAIWGLILKSDVTGGV